MFSRCVIIVSDAWKAALRSHKPMSGPRWTSGILHEHVNLILAPFQVDDFVIFLDSPSLCLWTRIGGSPCQFRRFQNFDGLDSRGNSEAFGQRVSGGEGGPH